MIQGGVYWLENHRAINAILVCLYTAFILLAHDIFVHLSVAIMNFLSLAVYEKVVAGAIVLLILGLIVIVWKTVQNRELQLRFTIFLASLYFYWLRISIH